MRTIGLLFRASGVAWIEYRFKALPHWLHFSGPEVSALILFWEVRLTASKQTRRHVEWTEGDGTANACLVTSEPMMSVFI